CGLTIAIRTTNMYVDLCISRTGKIKHVHNFPVLTKFLDCLFQNGRIVCGKHVEWPRMKRETYIVLFRLAPDALKVVGNRTVARELFKFIFTHPGEHIAAHAVEQHTVVDVPVDYFFKV